MHYSSIVSVYGDHVIISQYIAVQVFLGQKNFTLKLVTLTVSSKDGPYSVVVVGGVVGKQQELSQSHHITSHET